jgi:hypothetical protein
MSGLRAALRRVKESGVWNPSASAYIVRANLLTADAPVPSDTEALHAAAAWLCRAQDASADGGISGRYLLSRGWTSSYPETTGYVVPTLLALATTLGDDAYRERAARAVDFLLSVQLPEGGFPALEIAENRARPSPFNSAQIVHGLQRWHEATGDARALDAMVKAARWICDVQDSDGAWRAHFYGGLAGTYSAHAACWLAELGAYVGEHRFSVAAERNLRWVLSHRDPSTGWIDACGFSEADHKARQSVTHTIAYTLAGVLAMGERLQIEEAVETVRVAAEALMHRLERSRTLAGVLDHQWKPRASFVCLTGNVQLASIWLRLAETTGDLRFVNAAFKAIDEVKRAQSLGSRADGIRGGIAGSHPIGADYIRFGFPNWAAKFFLDALLAKERCLARWPATSAIEGDALQPSLRTVASAAPDRTPAAVVVYTSRVSPMFARLADDWRRRGFAPALVVIESEPPLSVRRLVSRFRHPDEDSAAICRRLGWRFQRVETLDSPAAIAAISAAAPDLAVNAGAGILRRPVLAAPRFGTLGVHMGLLPRYRGMNVAEWAVLHGDRVGCSVIRIDEGIDTGDVVAAELVDVRGCRSREELRERVDSRQLTLLAQTIAVVASRRVPVDGCPQRVADGRQFYRLHRDLVPVLEDRLSRLAS